MGDKKLTLNLGCGDTKLPGAFGVDVTPLKDFVDLIVDLNQIPYPFKDDCIDEIHLYHVLEHLDNPIEKMEELHRVLKPNGMLYVRVPHFSSLYAFTDMTHKRPFGLESFDIFRPDFGRGYYTSARFKILERKLRWFYTWPNPQWYMKHIVSPIWPRYSWLILKPLIVVVNWLISLSPIFFERFWCYYAGGAAEIYCLMQAVKKKHQTDSSLT